jgi:hypothetical protein
MPGWNNAVAASKFDKLPKETWADLPPVPSVFLLRLYTPTLPEGVAGLWGHNVLLSGKTRPMWAPDGGKDVCEFCKANAGRSKGDKAKNIPDERPFPPRRLAWAIGAVVAIINKGAVQWVDEPRIGLVEKGPEFWGELSRVEESVSTPDELDPNKKLLPADWREWLFRIEAGKEGVKASAVPFVAGHTFPPLDEEDLAFWDVTLSRRVAPWDNAASLVQKIVHGGLASSIENAVEEAYTSGGVQDGDPFQEEYVAEYESLLGLPIKGRDGVKLANWPFFIQQWKGGHYGRDEEDPLTFRAMRLADRKAVVDYMRNRAVEQGIKVPAVDDIPF